ncbi:translation initiation factor IF-2-like [Strigops habroptila]|uniref:translation initiation factor IF-2-like n=1 Tax=Strigops habroptila TaxID=2489341 RepID=UPI0011CF46D5|nr:translation initiation factor IF-2-like [Strigops habroptila]
MGSLRRPPQAPLFVAARSSRKLSTSTAPPRDTRTAGGGRGARSPARAVIDWSASVIDGRGVPEAVNLSPDQCAASPSTDPDPPSVARLVTRSCCISPGRTRRRGGRRPRGVGEGRAAARPPRSPAAARGQGLGGDGAPPADGGPAAGLRPLAPRRACTSSRAPRRANLPGSLLPFCCYVLRVLPAPAPNPPAPNRPPETRQRGSGAAAPRTPLRSAPGTERQVSASPARPRARPPPAPLLRDAPVASSGAFRWSPPGARRNRRPGTARRAGTKGRDAAPPGHPGRGLFHNPPRSGRPCHGQPLPPRYRSSSEQRLRQRSEPAAAARAMRYGSAGPL